MTWCQLSWTPETSSLLCPYLGVIMQMAAGTAGDRTYDPVATHSFLTWLWITAHQLLTSWSQPDLVRTRPEWKRQKVVWPERKEGVLFFFHIHGNLTFANDWGRSLRYWSGGERRVLMSSKTIMIVNVKEWGANVIWRSSCPRVSTLAFAVADVNVTSSFTMMWHRLPQTVTAASNNSETEL